VVDKSTLHWSAPGFEQEIIEYTAASLLDTDSQTMP
jgi:hypothetical protein